MRQNTVWAIVSIGFIVSSVSGQLLFEESFTGPLPGIISGNVKMSPDSLDYKFHQEKGSSVLIEDFDEGIRFKSLEAIADQKTIYISFCLSSMNSNTKDKFAGLILYQDGREIFGLGNDYKSEYFSFWRSDGEGTPIGEIPTKVDSQVHKMIMRVDYNPDGPEKIRVWLDPFCRRNELRQPDRIVSELEYELGFNEMRLRCGNQDSIWQFDELRIGSDWESVTLSDEKPGAYISDILKNAKRAQKSEMIGEKTARFWMKEISEDTVLPSFSFRKPREATGNLSNLWKLKPYFSTIRGKRYVYLDIHEDVDLYGTGEVTGSLLRNGSKIVLFNKDNYGYGKPDQLYQSHPWVLGVRTDGSAFGVIFDTPWKAEMDLRTGILFSTSSEVADFPVIVIEGQSPQEIMVKLADLTGHMPMPPRWALGYQQCRYSYYPDERAREIADTFRAKRIPCDVIWFDIDYMDGFRIFTFDPNQYPDPKSTNDYLHSLGFSSVWMIDPGVKYDPGYFVYDSGTASDAWVKNTSGRVFVGPVWPGDCVFPDFTIPAVRKWWGDFYKAFMAYGIDGVWNDMNEPAVFKEETEWTMPLGNHHRGGDNLPAGPHIQYHNVYGMLMVKASREGIQNANPDKRPFVLSRANFLGGHRYAATWTGDNKASWEHLKWSIPMSLNLSLSGQPFNGPDIGGFIDNATPELWAHWISVGAFYPFSRAHTSKDTANQEPWEFGQETEDVARVALQRRYRLMPYLYTVFQQSHKQGLPIMRPVFFADPTDISLRMEDQAFLLGQDVMVIPKWATDIRFPKGIWRSISLVDEDIAADSYQCDLKVRGGAIISLGPIVQTTQEIETKQSLTLIVVLDDQGQAVGTLYEDAGQGYDYLQGEYCVSTFTAQKNGGCVTVKCPRQRGNLSSESRLMSAVVIDDNGMHYGFGDICSKNGINVILGLSVE